MNFDEFERSIAKTGPPPGVPTLVAALWHDGKGNWEEAHSLAQEIETDEGAWVHAYLHRKEGDISNASYWYRKAGKSLPSISLEKEWKEIALALLK